MNINELRGQIYLSALLLGLEAEENVCVNDMGSVSGAEL